MVKVDDAKVKFDQSIKLSRPLQQAAAVAMKDVLKAKPLTLKSLVSFR